MRKALLLNDMRSPNVENLVIIKVGTAEELKAWYEEQRVVRYKDGKWEKEFRPGSELEWYNPAIDINVEEDYWGGIWTIPDDVGVGSIFVKAY
jgi:hypothetical protein